MKSFYFMLACLISNYSFAQTSSYIPLPESDAVWNFKLSHYCMNMGSSVEKRYSVFLSGDTIINNVNYIKISASNAELISGDMECCSTCIKTGYRGAFRQDSSERKVYFVPENETTEQLLYDFNLQINNSSPPYFNDPSATVLSVDSIIIDGEYRRRIKNNFTYNVYIIEGIGSTYGLIEYNPGEVHDLYSISLLCFIHNDVIIYPEDVDECFLITDIKSEMIKNDPIKIYPNPFSDFIIIETQDVKLKNVEIFDLNGRKIHFTINNESNRLDTRLLPKGMYYLNFIDIKNNVYRKVLICEN